MAVLADRFGAAVLSRFDSGTVDFDLLPTVLTVACVDVLDVDGAGLSLIDSLRVPLAASSEEVRRAEQLQTSLGEGPCLTAAATREPLVAGPAAMATQWPLFHRELTAQTPFRSVAALPLAQPNERPFAALDLYLRGPDPDPSLTGDEVGRDLAAVITSFLSSAPLTEATWTSEPVASWLGSGHVEHRMNVWAAVGLLMASADLDQSEGLACLRAYAFSHDTTIDHVAERLTSRQVPATDLTGRAPQA